MMCGFRILAALYQNSPGSFEALYNKREAERLAEKHKISIYG